MKYHEIPVMFPAPRRFSVILRIDHVLYYFSVWCASTYVEESVLEFLVASKAIAYLKACEENNECVDSNLAKDAASFPGS